MGSGKIRILTLILSISFLIGSEGIQLDSNGGYHVTIALDQNVDVAIENRANYIDNIESSFQSLAHRMWTGTKQSFFVNSIQIIIPSTWTDLEGVEEEPTVSTYASADVKISETQFPWVQNSNPCGLPGDFIELPTSFFNFANTGEYGANSKALLVQWARFRWGAWEEHGYPNDKRFPYFYQGEVSNQTQWLPTGCTNTQEALVGEYRLVNGTECDETSIEEPDSGCRFYPDLYGGNDDVTSSLMHYHFLESVDHFCDKDTHKSDVPNKQNYFCDYQSVLETILSSSDYKKLTDLSPTVPPLTSTVLRASSLPLLYVLIDQGYFDAQSAAPIVNVVMAKLAQLLALQVNENVVASVGFYPTNENDLNVQETLTWTPIKGHEDAFVDAMTPIKLNGPQFRDFGLAIQQAGNAIRNKNPDNGGVILIFKTNSPTEYSNLSSEKILENNLLRDNIKLFSIELPGVNRTNGNLVTLSGTTQGSGVVLKSASSPELTILLDTIRSIFTIPPPLPLAEESVPRIVYQAEVQPRNSYMIPINQGVELLTLHLSLPDEFAKASACVNPTTCVNVFTSAPEWGESDEIDTGKRFIHTGQLNLTSVTNAQFINFEYLSPVNGSGQLSVGVEGSKLVADYEINVVTTAQNGLVDFATVSNLLTPFAIYVKVTQDGKPVVKGINGIAELKLSNSSNVNSIPLIDDGEGNPDVAANDGVYSAIYVPQDGSYTLKINIEGTPVVPFDDEIISSHGASVRLLPPDQEDLGCGFGICDTAVPVEAFIKSVNYPGLIQVINRDSYKTGMPTRIRNLGINIGSSNSLIRMEYSAPKLVGETGSPTLYLLYTSLDRSKLIGLDVWSLPEGVKNPKNQTTSGGLPGQRVEVTYNSQYDALMYFTVVAYNNDYYSPISNIVSKNTKVEPETTTTTTTTTTRGTGSTSSTTPKHEDEKDSEDADPWIKKPAGIVTVVVIVLVVFVAAGVAYWYMKRKRANRTISTA